MKRKMIWITLVAMLVVSTLAACTQAATAPAGDKSEAEVLIDERCSRCHSTNDVYNAQMSADEWSRVIDAMVTKGAEVTEDEKNIMIDWLVARD